MHITNVSDISLPLAVWLVNDDYDYVDAENYISVTSLMRPLRQLVLPRLIQKEQRVAPDVEDFIARSLGHSLHSAIEHSWLGNYAKNLKKLGYPDDVIKLVKINPKPEEITADTIPIYLEQREIRQFKGYSIGGKFDMVIEGMVNDFKSTSVFSWISGKRDDEHVLQGSLYKWLNPKIITEEYIRINYIFTDWAKGMVRSNPRYPTKRVMHKDIPLLTQAQTEDWISKKIDLINKYSNVPENQVPECTDEELWRSDPQFKYYSNPAKTDGRSTKNFEDHASAKIFMAEKGGTGVIKIVPGEPKRCNYCDAYSVCTQKDRYFPNV